MADASRLDVTARHGARIGRPRTLMEPSPTAIAGFQSASDDTTRAPAAPPLVR